MSEPMWCDGCRSTGAIHCAHPDQCGNMLSATASADQWKAWLDDLPLPFTFDPAIGRLQDFITALSNLIDVPLPASPAEAERDYFAAENASLMAMEEGVAMALKGYRATFCHASPGSDTEFALFLEGFDAAADIARAALATQEAGNA